MKKIIFFTLFASFCFASLPDLKNFWIEFYRHNYAQAEKELFYLEQANLFSRDFTYDDYILIFAIKTMLYQEMEDRNSHDFSIELLKNMIESRYREDLINDIPKFELDDQKPKNDLVKASN